jgi:hypothetical protein
MRRIVRNQRNPLNSSAAFGGKSLISTTVSPLARRTPLLSTFEVKFSSKARLGGSGDWVAA